jgi:phosphoribosyl-AMP cyclohydrolase
LTANSNWQDELRFDADGLIPAIAQDSESGTVLMFAFMNRESLRRTLELGEVVYWSRSRQRLWHKGEESGHIQTLVELRTDCDRDVLLLKVRQTGGIACHTGRQNCFFNRLDDTQQWVVTEPVIKHPGEIYS